MNKVKDIPGIKISSYPLNEVSLMCKITMSYGDASELTKTDIAGLKSNTEFREWLVDKLCESFEEHLNKKGQ